MQPTGATQQSAIQFVTSTVGLGFSIGRDRFQTGTNDLFFYDQTAGDRMYISSAGNVGIGTTAPTNALQVNGSITAAGYTTTVAWTLVPNYSTFTSKLYCRRIGSFLQLRGNIDFSGASWGLVLGQLPAACTIAADIPWAPSACYTSTTLSPCFFSVTASNGTIAYYGPSGPTRFIPTGTFPAD